MEVKQQAKRIKTSGDIMAEFDKIFAQSEKRIEFKIKTGLIKQKQGLEQFVSPARMRFDEIEQSLIEQQ